MNDKVKPYIDAALAMAKDTISKQEQYPPTIYHVYENTKDQTLSMSMYVVMDMDSDKRKADLIVKTHYDAYMNFHKNKNRIIAAFLVSDAYLSQQERKEGETVVKKNYANLKDDPDHKKGIMVMLGDKEGVKVDYHIYEQTARGLQFTDHVIADVEVIGGIFSKIFPTYF